MHFYHNNFCVNVVAPVYIHPDYYWIGSAASLKPRDEHNNSTIVPPNM